MAVLITTMASRLVRNTTRNSFSERLKRGNFMRRVRRANADSSASRRPLLHRRDAFTSSPKSELLGLRRRRRLARAAFGGLDGDQLDVEHQRALRRAGAGGVVVRQPAGDPEAELVADRHQRNRFLPALDELV